MKHYMLAGLTGENGPLGPGEGGRKGATQRDMRTFQTTTIFALCVNNRSVLFFHPGKEAPLITTAPAR